MFNKDIPQIPLVILFLVVPLLIILFRKFFLHGELTAEWQASGNLIIYFITMISLHMLKQGLIKQLPSFRNAIGGILLKVDGLCSSSFYLHVLLRVIT